MHTSTFDESYSYTSNEPFDTLSYCNGEKWIPFGKNYNMYHIYNNKEDAYDTSKVKLYSGTNGEDKLVTEMNYYDNGMSKNICEFKEMGKGVAFFICGEDTIELVSAYCGEQTYDKSKSFCEKIKFMNVAMGKFLTQNIKYV